jgi:alkaline phosphatase D
VYGLASQSDAQYAIHLGDYLYEYPSGTYPTSPTASRIHDPSTEIYSLADYRTRHAQYKTDPDLKVLHASMPMIAVWDDHEVANDTYKDGAENHNASKEGSFSDRKAAALQAYHEWMPVRTGSDQNIIYRSFDFGSVLSLHMLDTRLIGRDKQVEFTDLLTPSTAATAQATLYSATRELMGSTQSTWLTGKIISSTATWQVLGQQVLMARMEFPVSVLSALNPATLTDAAALATGLASITAYVTAKNTPASSRTTTQVGLMNTTLNPKLGYNLDAWDGYPVAREKLLATVAAANKKLVVLSGDTHNAWHSQLTLAGYISASQAGLKVGEEFATPSVSSVGLESYFSTLPSANVKSIYESVVDDLKWMDPSRRGYLKMTFTKTQAKGEWVFVNSVKSTTYTVETPAVAETRTYAL